MKRPISHYFFLALIFLMLQPVSLRSEEKQSGIKPAEDLIHNGIVININFTEQELLNELGPPKDKKISLITNKYFDFNDTSILFEYEGLTVVYYKYNHPLNGWKKIRRIEVRNNEYKLKHGIKIGMNIEKTYEIIGRQYSNKFKENEKLYVIYESEDSVHEQIILVFDKHDKLIELIWSNWP